MDPLTAGISVSALAGGGGGTAALLSNPYTAALAAAAAAAGYAFSPTVRKGTNKAIKGIGKSFLHKVTNSPFMDAIGGGNPNGTITGGVSKDSFGKDLLKGSISQAASGLINNAIGQNPNNKNINYTGLPQGPLSSPVIPGPIAGISTQGVPQLTPPSFPFLGQRFGSPPPPQQQQAAMDPLLMALLKKGQQNGI